jgi:hypothetical protein
LPSKVLSKVHPQVLIAVTSTAIVGACSYPVFFKEVKPGHEIFSSEKPEVIRVAQEERRDEYRRLIKEQRKQHQDELETLRKKQEEA